MGLKPLVAILLLLTVSFAGCAGDKESDSTTTSTTSGTSTSTTSTGPRLNHAPTGSAGVAINGTTAVFTLNGTDPDGDALNWTLAFGDGNQTNGTQLPANATHVFASAGLFNATFTLADRLSNTSYNLTINATAVQSGLPQVDYQFTGTISGTWNPAAGYVTDPAEHTFEVTEAVPTMLAALTEGMTAPDLDYALIGPDGEEAAGTAGIWPVDGEEEPDLTVENPAIGTWTLRVWAGNALEGEYTVDITFP